MLQFRDGVTSYNLAHSTTPYTILFRLHSLDNERIKSLDGELLAVVFYLQFAFVFEVGILDMVDQPIFGKMNRIGRNWSRESFDLRHEINVQLLVGGKVSIVGFLHHALFVAEMFDDNVDQVLQGGSITWIFRDVEDSLE
jgi:hypothetical protein